MIPDAKLLSKYGLDVYFMDLLSAWKSGDIARYIRLLDKNRMWFFQSGLYTIMKHRMELLIYRNFFQQIYRIYGSEVIPVKLLTDLSAKMFVLPNEDPLSAGEVESIIVSLIDQVGNINSGFHQRVYKSRPELR
jgi:hypothetical protein